MSKDLSEHTLAGQVHLQLYKTDLPVPTGKLGVQKFHAASHPPFYVCVFHCSSCSPNMADRCCLLRSRRASWIIGPTTGSARASLTISGVMAAFSRWSCSHSDSRMKWLCAVLAAQTTLRPRPGQRNVLTRLPQAAQTRSLPRAE